MAPKYTGFAVIATVIAVMALTTSGLVTSANPVTATCCDTVIGLRE